MGGNDLNGGTTQAMTVQTQQAGGDGGKVARRAVLAAAAVGACAVATPFVVEKGVQLTETEVKALLQHEIGSLEGIALDEALAVAELTRKAVQVIVLPLARLFSTLGSGALGIMIGGLTKLKDLASALHQDFSFLNGLLQLLNDWQDNLTLLPISLDAYTNADINGAEAYLKALKAKVNSNNPV
jgi:hypothetical protein